MLALAHRCLPVSGPLHCGGGSSSPSCWPAEQPHGSQPVDEPADRPSEDIASSSPRARKAAAAETHLLVAAGRCSGRGAAATASVGDGGAAPRSPHDASAQSGCSSPFRCCACRSASSASTRTAMPAFDGAGVLTIPSSPTTRSRSEAHQPHGRCRSRTATHRAAPPCPRRRLRQHGAAGRAARRKRCHDRFAGAPRRRLRAESRAERRARRGATASTGLR